MFHKSSSNSAHFAIASQAFSMRMRCTLPCTIIFRAVQFPALREKLCAPFIVHCTVDHSQYNIRAAHENSPRVCTVMNKFHCTGVTYMTNVTGTVRLGMTHVLCSTAPKMPVKSGIKPGFHMLRGQPFRSQRFARFH